MRFCFEDEWNILWGFQISQMRSGVDVICATPGRLNDLLERGCIVSSRCMQNCTYK